MEGRERENGCRENGWCIKLTWKASMPSSSETASSDSSSLLTVTIHWIWCCCSTAMLKTMEKTVTKCCEIPNFKATPPSNRLDAAASPVSLVNLKSRRSIQTDTVPPKTPSARVCVVRGLTVGQRWRVIDTSSCNNRELCVSTQHKTSDTNER